MDFWAAQAQIATPMWDSPVQGFAHDQLTPALERILTKAASLLRTLLAETQTGCQAELEKMLQG